MKVRNGFVSNSSTSSYVILGVKFDIKDIKEVVEKVTGKEFNRKDYKEDYDYDDAIWESAWNLKRPSPENEWNIVLDEDILIAGKSFVSGRQDEGLNESVTDFEEMAEIAKKIEEYFGKKPKLFTGEANC